MRNPLLLSLLVAALAGAAYEGAAAQSQPAPAPKPATQQPATPKPTAPPVTQTPAQKPAQPAAPAPAPAAPAGGTAAAPTPRRAPATPPATSRAGMAITVTDAGGGTLGGVTVAADGPTTRNGETNGSGQVNFPGMLAGVYRLRFEGDGVVSFEKEVTVRPGLVLAVDVMLTPAKKTPPPPAPAPVAAPPPAPAKSGPAGQPLQVSVPRVLEGDFVGKNPRRESVLSCSGNTRTTMLQINQPMPERMYAEADVVYYVIGGEGTMRLDGKESKLALNDFISIPRGGSHSFERRGNRTLILLSVLGGEACDAPK